MLIALGIPLPGTFRSPPIQDAFKTPDNGEVIVTAFGFQLNKFI